MDATVITRLKPSRRRLQRLCLDKGYDYPFVDDAVVDCGYVGYISRRGTTPRKKKRRERARRWVVERTHSWINRSRRLLVRWERRLRTTKLFSRWRVRQLVFSKLGRVSG
jgi:putative transposase